MQCSCVLGVVLFARTVNMRWWALFGFLLFVCLFFFLALEPCCVDDKSETNGALDAGHTYTREKSRIARSCR
jgi:hypothetical protein